MVMDYLKFGHFLLPIASKSGNLNLLEASGPVVGFTVIIFFTLDSRRGR